MVRVHMSQEYVGAGHADAQLPNAGFQGASADLEIKAGVDQKIAGPPPDEIAIEIPERIPGRGTSIA